jgi:2-polyprenyl-6-methoxyphenol hydroxylase-like FAD-dependent oxidoreductase
MFAALTLARAGHKVTLVERDDVQSEQRPGAPQAFQSHSYLARFVHNLRDVAPDVQQQLMDEGAKAYGADYFPPWISDRQPRPEMADCVTLSCRRNVFDAVLARALAREPGVTLVRSSVRGLLTSDDAAPPTVVGVGTDAGELRADLVVDATGRRSRFAQWVTAAGGLVDEGAQAPCGNMYYTRFYAVHDGLPEPMMQRGFGEAADLGYMAAVAFQGEGATFSISLQLEDDDEPMRAVRDADVFETVARRTPVGRHIDPELSSPISGVHVMAGLVNRLCRLVVDGKPGVLGLVQVGDSVCITNPSFGRGVSFASGMAVRLRDALQTHSDMGDVALDYDASHDVDVLPWFTNAVALDVATRGRWRAALYGEPAEAPARHALDWRDLFNAAMRDRVAFDAMLGAANLLVTPEQALATGAEALAAIRADGWVPPFPPPTPREAMLEAAQGASVS